MNRTITIRGIGKLSLKPDQTVVSLTQKNLHAVYEKAIDEAAQHLEQLRHAIAEIGFSRDDLKTASFEVDTEYESARDENGNYQQRFVGYRVTHGLKLVFDFDAQRLSKVLGAIAACIAKPELNVQFTVKDKEAVSAALLESACRDAKSKAEMLSKASGVILGDLLSIDYHWGELHLHSPTHYRMDNACMMKSAAPIEIAPDAIDVKDGVTFVWAIQ